MDRKEGRIPIAKNTDSDGRKTVRVLDGKGDQIGSTYPRRAAGLVKKGRAYYVNDFIIRLSMSDASLPDSRQKSEVMKMDNQITIDSTNRETGNQVLKLYFDPRKWSFNKECKDNVGNRTFITGPDGVLAESYMIGDWGAHWTEIVSETLLLPKNTDCSFTFWLNGGENDRNDEVCRFEIVFNNDYEQRLIYNLNRNYILPVKKLNGWELYEIPFRTQDNEYTQLKFVAMKAYMTVLTAKDVSAYETLADIVDPFEAERPQRHNIIFSDGFPSKCWYSTQTLQKTHEKQNAANPDGQNGSPYPPLPPQVSQNPEMHMPDSYGTSAAISVKQIFDAIRVGKYASAEDFEDVVMNKSEIMRGITENALHNLQNALQQISNEFQTSVGIRLDAISASLDALSSTCDMLEDFDMESLADNISIRHGNDDEEEDLEDILSDAADSISDMADELRDDIEEIADRLADIRESLSI